MDFLQHQVAQLLTAPQSKTSDHNLDERLCAVYFDSHRVKVTQVTANIMESRESRSQNIRPRHYSKSTACRNVTGELWTTSCGGKTYFCYFPWTVTDCTHPTVKSDQRPRQLILRKDWSLNFICVPGQIHTHTHCIRKWCNRYRFCFFFFYLITYIVFSHIFLLTFHFYLQDLWLIQYINSCSLWY